MVAALMANTDFMEQFIILIFLLDQSLYFLIYLYLLQTFPLVAQPHLLSPYHLSFLILLSSPHLFPLSCLNLLKLQMIKIKEFGISKSQHQKTNINSTGFRTVFSSPVYVFLYFSEHIFLTDPWINMHQKGDNLPLTFD